MERFDSQDEVNETFSSVKKHFFRSSYTNYFRYFLIMMINMFQSFYDNDHIQYILSIFLAIDQYKKKNKLD